MRKKARNLRLLALPMIALLFLAVPLAAEDSFRPWLDRDGNPLPFRSDAELLDFLANAQVVGSKQLSGGINNPYRLDLELDGVTARAIFRDVDVTRRGGNSAAERLFPSFRDSYAFEVAAYAMSRLLDLDNVPPVILYEWQDTQGSLQLWVEHASSEADRIEQGADLADPAGWHLQQTAMKVFDNLIYNFDRNHGNQLLDERGKLWFIDHTRSFKYTPYLPTRDDILVVDEGLWTQLQALDKSTLRSEVGIYLDEPQTKALIKRHRLLVKYIQQMIAERGGEQVLLNTSSAASAS